MHVGHDCCVEDDVILSSGAALAGHVTLGRGWVVCVWVGGGGVRWVGCVVCVSACRQHGGGWVSGACCLCFHLFFPFFSISFLVGTNIVYSF